MVVDWDRENPMPQGQSIGSVLGERIERSSESRIALIGLPFDARSSFMRGPSRGAATHPRIPLFRCRQSVHRVRARPGKRLADSRPRRSRSGCGRRSRAADPCGDPRASCSTTCAHSRSAAITRSAFPRSRPSPVITRPSTCCSSTLIRICTTDSRTHPCRTPASSRGSWNGASRGVSYRSAFVRSTGSNASGSNDSASR